MKAAKKPKTVPPSATAIERGKVYPLRLFLQITGMGSRGLRTAQKQGLRVVYQGRTAFVVGDDFADFCMSPRRVTERWSNEPEAARA